MTRSQPLTSQVLMRTRSRKKASRTLSDTLSQPGDVIQPILTWLDDARPFTKTCHDAHRIAQPMITIQLARHLIQAPICKSPTSDLTARGGVELNPPPNCITVKDAVCLCARLIYALSQFDYLDDGSFEPGLYQNQVCVSSLRQRPPGCCCRKDGKVTCQRPSCLPPLRSRSLTSFGTPSAEKKITSQTKWPSLSRHTGKMIMIMTTGTRTQSIIILVIWLITPALSGRNHIIIDNASMFCS